MSRWLREGVERKSPTRNRPRAKAAIKGLGLRLQALREKLELSQEEAAHRAGLSSKTLQDYEQARSNPTLASLVAIAEVYGVSLGELFRGV